MASMVALFSTLGENIPIFKREKILQAYSEGYINRLHYRATCLLIMAMTVMVRVMTTIMMKIMIKLTNLAGCSSLP